MNTFEQWPKPAQKPEEKSTQEWREHFGPLAEMQEEMDKIVQKELAREQQSVKEVTARQEAKPQEARTYEEFLEWIGSAAAPKPQEAKVEQKISAVGKIEAVGSKRAEKWANATSKVIEKGVSHLFALDKWGVLALKGAGKLAAEAGGILGGIGLSPLVAAEEVGREVGGRAKIWWETRKEKSSEKDIKKVEKIQPEGSGDVVAKGLEILRERADLAKEEADKARENLTKKGKIISFISKLPFFKRFAG